MSSTVFSVVVVGFFLILFGILRHGHFILSFGLKRRCYSQCEAFKCMCTRRLRPRGRIKINTAHIQGDRKYTTDCYF